MTKFLIIDGNSLACRAKLAFNPKFHKIDLHNSKGKITGGTYRFFIMLNKLLNQIKPTHIVVVWDVNRNTWRRKLYPEYKINRETNLQNKESLYIMFEDVKKILHNINILNVEFDGYEGDDLLGTFSNISTADQNFIVSGDKDSFQLVDNYTKIIYPKNGFREVEIIDEDYVKNKYNLKSAKQFVDFKALIGDIGDNIPGIIGCGEKSAAKLLDKYGSVKNIVKEDNIEGINKIIKENIAEWKTMAETILKLVTIDKKVPIEIEFDDCKCNINWYNALPIFEELEFNSFIKNIDNLYRGE